MHDSDLPASVLQTIEQRVKRRIRSQMIMAVLTIAFFFSVLMASTLPTGWDASNWGMASVGLLLVWIPYTSGFCYRALVERGVQREIEHERQHQLQVAHAAGRKREDRSGRLAGRADEADVYLGNDGELWSEDELAIERKPKRRLDA